MTVYGWDIGGAHLKRARMNDAGELLDVRQAACPLWLGLDQLDQAFTHLMQDGSTGPKDRHVITMTGELTDYFENRAQGVSGILEHICLLLPGTEISVFAGPRGFLDPHRLEEDDWTWIASANWLASGMWAARKRGEGLFMDVGSTTSDLMLFSSHAPANRGYTDHERMVSDELIYTGILRTPIMTLSKEVAVLGRWTHPMAEHFATTADLYRVTGEIREATDQYPAADQGPKTRDASIRRLARQFGLDADSLPDGTIERLARFLRDGQIHRLKAAVQLQISRGLIADQAPLVGAGIGRFLIENIAHQLGRPFLDFQDLFEWAAEESRFDAADCGPAAAVAALSIE
jgi:(4-(4-[2-(gamma-L-glutamylamino)ethyl]phenoxymethyl)furan-2-yl)methanamine synthase